MTEIKLQPCPFCGGKAEFGTNPVYRTIRVYCSKCKAASNQFESNVYKCAAEDAANAWNKRTKDTAEPDDKEMKQMFSANPDLPVKHDKWEKRGTDDSHFFKCSECGHYSRIAQPFCKNCGAEMKEENSD